MKSLWSVLLASLIAIVLVVGWRVRQARHPEPHTAKLERAVLDQGQSSLQYMQNISPSEIDHLTYSYDTPTGSFDISDKAAIAQCLNAMKKTESVDDCCGQSDTLTVNLKPGSKYGEDGQIEFHFFRSDTNKTISSLLDFLTGYKVNQAHHSGQIAADRVRKVKFDDQIISAPRQIQTVADALIHVDERAFDFKADTVEHFSISLIPTTGDPIDISFRFKPYEPSKDHNSKGKPLPGILWECYKKELASPSPID